MTVDEKGLHEIVARAIADEAHAGGDYGIDGASAYAARPWEFLALARAAIEAYLSARSAEPVASEIGEEEIARATQIIACVMARDNHAIARATAEMVLSLLQPALERARREGYAIGFSASGEGWNAEHPFDYDFAGNAEWQEQRDRRIAAAIRKGSGE
jgi:hypothetical protein